MTKADIIRGEIEAVAATIAGIRANVGRATVGALYPAGVRVASLNAKLALLEDDLAVAEAAEPVRGVRSYEAELDNYSGPDCGKDIDD